VPAFPHELTRSDLERSIHGALQLTGHPDGVAPLRLPTWTRAQQADGGIERMSGQTSGVRLRLRTAAHTIRLEATFTRTVSAAHPARPFRLVAETASVACTVTLDEGTTLVETRDGDATPQPGPRSIVHFSLESAPGERVVTIWLPLAAACVVHSVRADAPLTPCPAEGPRWLHYGSSISHGSDLHDPRGPWPQQVARELRLDLVNLGFAGNAMLDPFVARAIADAPAHLITLGIGINIVNGDAMRARTFAPAVHGFLDRVREGHPTVPVSIITAFACPIHEDSPGPTRADRSGLAAATPRDLRPGDGSLTLARTRSLLEQIVASRRDALLYLVDGLSLLGVDDGHLPDNLHPDQAGHDLIAARFAPHARRLLHSASVGR